MHKSYPKPQRRRALVLHSAVLLASANLVTTTIANTVNVTAGNASALSTAVNGAQPGDTIVLLGGTYNTSITARINGTAALPINVIGTNGATINSSGTSGSGISCDF